MKKYKNKFKNYLLQNQKGLFKNLQYLLKNLFSTNLDYKREISTSAVQKTPYWYFNGSSHLDYATLFSLGGEFLVRVLKERGFECNVLLCAGGPKFSQTGASTNNPSAFMPCMACYSFKKQNFDNNFLIEFKSKDLNIKDTKNEDNLDQILKPSLNWILRGNKNLKLSKEFNFRMKEAAILWLSFLDGIDKDSLPNSIILFNGISFPECVIKYFMEKNGVNVITFETGYRENSIYFTNESATDYEFPFDINKVLTALEKNKLDNYLEKRFSGDFTRSSIKYWNEMTDIDDDLKNKCESFKRNIIIFLNVPFDTSQVKASYLFDDIYQWIDELILFAEKNTDLHFIFRSHPDEIRSDKRIYEKTSDYILQNTKKDKNISVIDAADTTSSYILINRSDLVLTYNSTIGLESVFMNKKTISAGYSHFSRLDYFKIYQDKEEYFKCINKKLLDREFDGNDLVNQIQSYFYQMIFESAIDFSEILIPDNSKKYGFKLIQKEKINENKIDNFENYLVKEIKALEK